jgi:hypothetical protein
LQLSLLGIDRRFPVKGSFGGLEEDIVLDVGPFIYPIYDKESKSSENKDKLRKRHLWGGVKLPVVSLSSTASGTGR